MDAAQARHMPEALLAMADSPITTVHTARWSRSSSLRTGIRASAPCSK